MKSFHLPMGGMHPHILHNPLSGRSMEAEELGQFPRISIPLLQHIGPLAKPLVEVGQQVYAGQLIADTELEGQEKKSFLNTKIHSPIAGTITSIEPKLLSNGMNADFITIDADEHPLSSPEQEEAGSWREKGYKEILQRIASAGIVGMGGATFPTNTKLQLPADKRCEFLLINGAECEPYLHSDATLMEFLAEDLAGGIEVLAECLRPKHIIIGIEENKKHVLPKLEQGILNYRQKLVGLGLPAERLPKVNLALMKTTYPQGSERQLIYSLTGREVPAGKLPLEVGCIVINVASTKAIYDAVEHMQPLTHRMVTISGGAIKEPKVFWVPIGTPIKALIDACGGFSAPFARMINGGPMMGFSFYHLDIFVTKGSSGFLFLTKEEVHKKKQTPCIRCNRCLEICPIGLEPTNMFKYINNEEISSAVDIGLLNCIECGACSSSCPAQIPLTQGFRMGKLRWRLSSTQRRA